jgi:hypothetical protein
MIANAKKYAERSREGGASEVESLAPPPPSDGTARIL